MKNGYYWVLIDDPDGGEPEIAYWDGDTWSRCGTDIGVNRYYNPPLIVLDSIETVK